MRHFLMFLFLVNASLLTADEVPSLQESLERPTAATAATNPDDATVTGQPSGDSSSWVVQRRAGVRRTRTGLIDYALITDEATVGASTAGATAIRGTWNLVSLHVAGKTLSEESVKPVAVSISNNELTVLFDGRVLSDESCKLDASQSPATIDLWTNEQLTLGIYRLDQGRLTMRLNARGADRPARLPLEIEKNDDVTMVLVRADAQDKLKLRRRLQADIEKNLEIQRRRVPCTSHGNNGHAVFVIDTPQNGKPSTSWRLVDEVVVAESNTASALQTLVEHHGMMRGRGGRVMVDPDVGCPLFTINADGSGLRVLFASRDFATMGSPEWSRDGQHIALDAWRSLRGGPYVTHIMTIRADGTDARDLGPGAMPSWSPDGKRLALSQYCPFGGVWIMNADGSGRQRVDADGWGIQWSPNGEQVAYVDRGQCGSNNLCVFDVVDRVKRPLLEEPYQRIFWGSSWSPDGKHICFKGIAPNGASQIAIVSAEGEANQPKVIFEGDVEPTVSWTAAGKPILIAMKRETDRNIQIYQIDPSGDTPPTLLPGQDPNRSNRDMSWSPDGETIVFRSQKGQ